MAGDLMARDLMAAARESHGVAPSYSLRRRLFLLALVLAAIGCLASLGVWQLHRRAWKHEWIERIDERVHAAATDPPLPQEWPRVNDVDYSYRHVRLHGVFLKGVETFVETTTARGQGYWVLTPLRDDLGFTILVNRGFLPLAMRSLPAAAPPEGETSVTGLLRVTEPQGRFLRPNRPLQNRWYSRDVGAIAAARGLSRVAPYFVDAENSGPDSWPRGGMTVTRLPDNHLVYALTWFGLALMLAAWAVTAVIRDCRLRYRLR